MIAVIFEVMPKEGHVDAYLDAAVLLRPHLENMVVATVIRDYGMFDRAQAPADSKAAHGE